MNDIKKIKNLKERQFVYYFIYIRFQRKSFNNNKTFHKILK